METLDWNYTPMFDDPVDEYAIGDLELTKAYETRYLLHFERKARLSEADDLVECAAYWMPHHLPSWTELSPRMSAKE